MARLRIAIVLLALGGCAQWSALDSARQWVESLCREDGRVDCVEGPIPR